jgi:zinc transport system ATP-binding protein
MSDKGADSAKEAATVISLRGVSFHYDGPPVLENIDFDIKQGEFIGLVGPNGGGKSTLLKLILGLLNASQGEIHVLGKAPNQVRHDLGYVPQFAHFNRDFPISVEDTVLMGRMGKTRSLFGYRRQDRDIAAQAMHECGILALRKRRLHQLSGGQVQRVLIARALTCEPEILLLDEPTANIDMRAEEDIFDVLKRLNQRLSIVLVSHDIGFISGYVGRVACLNRTLVCHHTDRLTGKNIMDIYDNPVCAIHHDYGVH